MLRRPMFLAAIAAVCALALPAAASASEVHVSMADNLFVIAGVGEENDIVLTNAGANLHIFDAEGVTAGPECAPVDANEATCPLAAFDFVYVLTGNSSDKVKSAQSDPIVIDGSDSSQLVADAFGAEATIYGGAGPDHLTSGANDDHLYGGGGLDWLFAGGGDDELHGGEGNDPLYPGTGDDDIHGDAGNDHVNYEDRNLPLTLSIDDNDNDGAIGELDNIHTDVEGIESGQGADEITGSLGPDQLHGRGGGDTIRGGGGGDTAYGGAGNDDIRGESGTDFLVGDDGDDKLNGGFDSDVIYAGDGDDELSGGFGNDTLGGGAGDDQILGGGGNDDLLGEPGDDTLAGNAGADTLSGGADSDTVDYANYTSPVTVDLDGGNGDDGIEGEGDSVAADVENAIGGSGADTLIGNPQQNVLVGAAGDDTIDGGANNDNLIGASGSDTLHSVDTVLDIVDCGTDIDTVESDPIDTLIDCDPPPAKPGDGGGDEQPPVDPPVTPVTPVPPAANPKLAIGPSSARVSRSRFVKLSVSCPRSASARCTGSLRLQRSVKGKVKMLGRKGFKVPAGAKRKIKIKVSKSTAKSVKRRPLKVNAVGKATAGASDSSRKVTLKRAARRKR